MSKKVNARPLKQVVRAKKRSGSGLPGAAQRARSRQREATLRAVRRNITKVLDRSFIHQSDEDWADLARAEEGLWKLIERERRRRLFGANDGSERRLPAKET